MAWCVYLTAMLKRTFDIVNMVQHLWPQDLKWNIYDIKYNLPSHVHKPHVSHTHACHNLYNSKNRDESFWWRLWARCPNTKWLAKCGQQRLTSKTLQRCYTVRILKDTKMISAVSHPKQITLIDNTHYKMTHPGLSKTWSSRWYIW